MLTNRTRFSLVLLAFVPGYAFAHGEQVLLFPLGTLVAVVGILVISSLRTVRWSVRIVASLFTLATSIPFWLVPGNHFPAALRYTGWGNFIVGFLPSFILGTFALLLLLRRDSARSRAQLFNQADR